MCRLSNIAAGCRLYTVIFLCLIFHISHSQNTFKNNNPLLFHGAIIQGDTNERKIALVFTGHEYGEGGKAIATALKQEKVKASFFLSGDFYRTKSFQKIIRQLKTQGHYLGANGDEYIPYCDQTKPDSLLVSQEQFTNDLNSNYAAMKSFGLSKSSSPYFLPYGECANDDIAKWATEMGLQLINRTPGTMSYADYTTPDMPDYCNSDTIYQSIINKAIDLPQGLNGHILLFHMGTAPGRTDKFYHLLPLLLQELTGMGYKFVRIDQLLNNRTP